MTPLENSGLRLLIKHWQNMTAALDKLGQYLVRPDDGYRIFGLLGFDARTPAGQIAYTAGPVVFQVSERASAAPNMYIVVQGRIYLDEDALRGKRLETMNFGTEVGYFRFQKNGLNHVYGAHYDYSLSEAGHPVFHSQMKSFNARSKSVSENFDGVDQASKDHVENILRTVRQPTAQMDFFSVVVQIAADHFLTSDAGQDQVQAFDDLREVSKAVTGAGHRWPELTTSSSCMRARHWYPGHDRLFPKDNKAGQVGQAA